MFRAERELLLKQKEDKIEAEKSEYQKIEAATRKKEQIMSKQKKEFETKKAEQDKKHEEELTAALSSIQQQRMTGAMVSAFVTLIIAYFLFSG